jgi:replicative DNA helicase
MPETPHNRAAEEALLGAVFMNNGVLDQVSGIVEGGDFFFPVLGRIFETALAMRRKGGEANPVTLWHYFAEDRDLAEVGGANYLARMAAAAVTVVNAPWYAREINALSIRREALGLRSKWAAEMAGSVFEDMGVAALLDEMRSDLDALSARLPGTGTVDTLSAAAHAAGEAIEAAWRREGALMGCTSGLTDVDERLGGFRAPDLIVLAGRPGMGKTALATGMGLAAAKAGTRVAVISLEMSAKQLAERILSLESGIVAERLSKGQIGDDDWPVIRQAQAALDALPFHIDDSSGMTVERIAGAAHRLKRQGLGLLIIDHLGHIQPPHGLRSAPRVQQVSHITAALKALAKDLDLPVIALSQLSRAVQSRDNKRPQLSDLRDSGSIEQDADLVLFLYREAYYLEREEPDDAGERAEWADKLERVKALAELHVAKNRHGATGRIDLIFNGPRMQFCDRVRRKSGSA